MYYIFIFDSSVIGPVGHFLVVIRAAMDIADQVFVEYSVKVIWAKGGITVSHDTFTVSVLRIHHFISIVTFF